jgi:hypothetical protein
MLARTAKRKEVDDEAHRTRDQATILRWLKSAEDGRRWSRARTFNRIDFDDPDGSVNEKLRPVPGEDWFRVFDDRGLEFLYQERTRDGKISRFSQR